MKKRYRISILVAALILASLAIAKPFSDAKLELASATASSSKTTWVNKEVKLLGPQAKSMNKNVLRLSLIAYFNAKKQGLSNKDILTVIDYSKPSIEKRLWVFDLKNNKTLFNTWVAHGKNSGDLNATSFSNASGSLKSSLGLFLTDAPYIGGHGTSLRLRGLEQGFNDHAYQRQVVIHGAWYVNPATIQEYGRIGRSWGCPAVSQALSSSLINVIKNKTLVFAYYPDQRWLTHSHFIAA